MAQAAAEENLAAICWAIVTMVAVVLLIDVLLWKPLTAWAEKFRITQSESAVRKTSAVLTIIRQSHIDEMLDRLFQPVGELFDTLTRPLAAPEDAGPLRQSPPEAAYLTCSLWWSSWRQARSG